MVIHSIVIKNFKSIRQTEQIRIKAMNVLIGPNGAGKSNFISFFKFLNRLYEQQLQLYINQNGRAENFLYFGRKNSDYFTGDIFFTGKYLPDDYYTDKNTYVDGDDLMDYEFTMIPDQSGGLIFGRECSNITYPDSLLKDPEAPLSNQAGNSESVLKDYIGDSNSHIKEILASCKTFHFNDTSFNSKVKQPAGTTDYANLAEDGGNLAAFLYRLQESSPQHFKIIEKVIQSIAPFFGRFYLRPDEINPQQIFLRWMEKGSDHLFNAHNLSDGTLRMICLTTLLMQPDLPRVIIIDEPELGLHPFAVQKLAAMLKSASTKTQIIVSTQSINLVDQFTADDVIVVERENNQTVFKRQSEEALATWREEYSLGELWSKNVLGGTP